MKRILPFAIFAGVAMMAAVWCIGWWAQARAIRQHIEKSLADASLHGGTAKAEAVTVSGFPTRMVITLTNPSISVPLDQTLTNFHKRAMAAAGNSAGVLTAPTYPKSQLSHALNGSISFSTNALADELTLHYSGADTTTVIRDDGVSALSTEYQGELYCRVLLKRDVKTLLAQMWDLQQLLTPESIGKRLTSLECATPGGITTNATTGQMASSIAPGHLRLIREPSDQRATMTFDMRVKDFEIFPAGDEVYNAIRRAFTPTGQNYTPATMSLYGKQSLELSGSVDAPLNTPDWQGKPYRVDISRFQLENAAGTSSGSVLIAATPSGTATQGEIAVNLVSEFTPQQAAIAKMTLTQLLDESMQRPGFAETYGTAPRADMEAAFFEALPEVSSLGKLTQKIKLNYTVDASKNEGSVNITELELSSRDYGVTGSGSGSISGGNVIPNVNATLTCRNCLPMIDMVATYMARAQLALAAIHSPQAASFSLPPEKIAGAKGFLTALGTTSGIPEDLSFVIKTDAGALSVNGKSFADILQMAQLYFNPQPETAAPAK